MDLDDFKVVNDTRGHVMGDEVLTGVARKILREKLQSDTAVRLGGGQFVMLLPETDETSAVALAERVRKSVASAPASRTTTISAGVAAFPASGRTGPDLLRADDSALYAAKHRGKNMTVLHDGTGDATPDGVRPA